MFANKVDIDEDKIFLLEFIEVYRSLTSLWDVRNKNYSDRQIKDRDSQLLLEKYRQRYPNADKAEVNRKIHNLRSNYRRELRRINNINKSGAGFEVEITSGLWYYDALSFIQDTETPSKSKTSMGQAEDEGEPKRKTLKSNESGIDCLIDLASQRLNEKPNAFFKAGEFWALKLEKMEPTQATIAEKLIGEVIFYGQLGQLGVNAYVAKDNSVLANLSMFDSNLGSPYRNTNSSNFIGARAPQTSPGQPNRNLSNIKYIRPLLTASGQQNMYIHTTQNSAGKQNTNTSNVRYVHPSSSSAMKQIYFNENEQPLILEDGQNAQDITSYLANFE